MGHLNIPSFADFLAEMGPARQEHWQTSSLRDVQREIGFSFDLTNPDDSRRFVTAMFVVNQRATVLMLSDYHDWLIRKLDDTSLHLM